MSTYLAIKDEMAFIEHSSDDWDLMLSDKPADKKGGNKKQEGKTEKDGDDSDSDEDDDDDDDDDDKDGDGKPDSAAKPTTKPMMKKVTENKKTQVHPHKKPSTGAKPESTASANSAAGDSDEDGDDDDDDDAPKKDADKKKDSEARL